MSIDRKLIKGIVLEKYCLEKKRKDADCVDVKNLDFIISLTVKAIEQCVAAEEDVLLNLLKSKD